MLGETQTTARVAKSSLSSLGQRYVVVFAYTLKQEKGRRAVPIVDDEVWTTRADGISFSRRKCHLLLRLAQEQLHASLDHIERILNVGVKVPGNLLRSGDLEFANAETWSFGVTSAALDF